MNKFMKTVRDCIKLLNNGSFDSCEFIECNGGYKLALRTLVTIRLNDHVCIATDEDELPF
jgi:hypothetical protein